MKKFYIIAIILLLSFSAASLASQNEGVFSKIFDFFKSWSSITGYTGFTGNPSGGMNLTVWDGSDSATVYRLQRIKFYANLTNATDGSAIDNTQANVSITFVGFGATINMLYNSTSSLWERSVGEGSNNKNGTFEYYVTANSPLFSPDFIIANDSATVDYACLNLTIAGDDFQIIQNEILCTDSYAALDADQNGFLIINTSDVTIDCNDSIMTGDYDSIAMFLGNSTKNVVIENCNLTNYGYGIWAGSINGNAFNTTITNNAFSLNNYSIVYGNATSITNNEFDNDMISAVSGLNASYGAYIYNNTFFNCTDICVKDSGFSNTLLDNIVDSSNIGLALYAGIVRQNNSIANGNLINNSMTGILVQDDLNFPSSEFNNYVQVTGNVIDNTLSGIVANGSTNTIVSGNVLHNSTIAITDMNTSGAEYSENMISESETGVLTDNSTSPLFENNNITLTSMAMQVAISDGITIRDSNIYDLTEGIIFNSSFPQSGALIRNVTFSNVSDAALFLGVLSIGTDVSGNIFYYNKLGAVVQGEGNSVYNNNFTNNSISIYQIVYANFTLVYNNTITDCYSDKSSNSTAILEGTLPFGPNYYENNTVYNCNISIQLSGNAGFRVPGTQVKGNSINLSSFGIFLDDGTGSVDGYAVIDVLLQRNLIYNAAYGIYLYSSNRTNITGNRIVNSSVADIYMIDNTVNSPAFTRIWLNSLLTNGVNRTNDVNTSFCVNNEGNFYTNETSSLNIGDNECGQPQMIGSITISGGNITMNFTAQGADQAANYTLQFINSSGIVQNIYYAGSLTELKIPHSYIIENLSGPSPKTYNVSVIAEVYSSVHYAPLVILGSITAAPDNNWVCLNTSRCEYDNINDALAFEGATGEIFLMEENYTQALTQNYTTELVLLNATGANLDCAGFALFDNMAGGGLFSSSLVGADGPRNISLVNCVVKNGKVAFYNINILTLRNDSPDGISVQSSSEVVLENSSGPASFTNTSKIRINRLSCTDVLDYNPCLQLANITNATVTNMTSNGTGTRSYGFVFDGNVINLTLNGARFSHVGDVFFAASDIYDSDFRNIVSDNAGHSIFFGGNYYRIKAQNITINQTSASGPMQIVTFVNSTLRNIIAKSNMTHSSSGVSLSGTVLDNITADSQISYTGTGVMSTIKNSDFSNLRAEDCAGVSGENISLQDSRLLCRNNIKYSSITGQAFFKNNTVNCSDSQCFSGESGIGIVLANNTFSDAGNSTEGFYLEGMRNYSTVFYDSLGFSIILNGTSPAIITNSTLISFGLINGSFNESMALINADGADVTVYFRTGFLADCTDVCSYATSYVGVTVCVCDYFEDNVFTANGARLNYTTNFNASTTKIPGRPDASLRYAVVQLAYPVNISADDSIIDGNTFKSSRMQQHTIFLSSNNNNLTNNNFITSLFASPVLDTGSGNSFCVNGVGNFYEQSLTPMTGDCGPISGSIGDQDGEISTSWKKQDSSKTVNYDVFLNSSVGGVPFSIASGILPHSLSYDASNLVDRDVQLIIIPWINGSRFNGTKFISNMFRINPLAAAVAGGGGGAGAPIIMQVAQLTVTDSPQEVKLLNGEQLKFLLDSIHYTLKISGISVTSAEIYVAGTTMQLGLNKATAIDLNGDKVPDVLITLKSTVLDRPLNGEKITEAYVEIVKYILPGAAPGQVISATPGFHPTVEKPAPAVAEKPAAPKKAGWIITLYAAVIMVAAIALGFLIKRIRRKK